MEFGELESYLTLAATASKYPFWLSSCLLFVKTGFWAYEKMLDLRMKRIDVLKKEDEYEKEKP